MLLVALTCTSKDIVYFKNRILVSFNNFRSVFHEDVFFIVICQEDSSPLSSTAHSLFNNGFMGCVFFNRVNYLSVSRARNYAIDYAKSHNFARLIFHDVSLIYAKKYLEWVQGQDSSKLISGHYEFTDEVKSPNEDGHAEEVIFREFHDMFVCSYVFPVNVHFPYFDERFGPGENSMFISGEDFLFLRRFFQLNPNLRNFVRYSGIGIVHPTRPNDNSKQLNYALGQGKIHQVFLIEEKSLYALWRCIVFFGNAFFRLLIFKRNSFIILLQRIKGFFDYKTKI